VIKGLALVLLVASSEISGPARVIDGDTLQIGQERIRLFGIDAPEQHQTCQRDSVQYTCGREAAEALRRIIGARPLTCAVKDIDRYHRAVAVCRAGGVDVNRSLVESGWAVAYRRYSTDYVAAEDAARVAKRGLWAGQFVPPWAYRSAPR
jgi:endonuclease YncB( thermonuclease family)